jgi:hypothetical protein
MEFRKMGRRLNSVDFELSRSLLAARRVKWIEKIDAALTGSMSKRFL